MLEAMTEELSSLGHRVVSLRAIPIFVAANPMALKRALRNLLINAATHGLGARWSLDTRASDAIITIEDDGPGIPQDLLGRVFEPFFRVDPARRKTAPGAGLGLAIAREIINRLGGEVEIVNRPLGGLSQTIRLPRSCKQGEAG
jgi:signal transduction histidine kinase